MAASNGNDRGSSNGARGVQPIEALLQSKPPHNLEAERGVLGSILMLPEVCDDVALILRPDDFYGDANRRLYAEIVAMYEHGERIDLTLLINRLKNANLYEAIGGAPYLAEIANSVPTAANATYYARIVRDKSTLRALIYAGTEVLTTAYDQSRDGDKMLDFAEERIFSVRDQRQTATNTREIKHVLEEAFELIDRRMEHGATGAATGFVDLDKYTGGLHSGELVIIAGRPAMGKTALATNIAENVAIDGRLPTLFVSLEMSRLELVQRMMCSRGQIDGEKIRRGYLSGEEHHKLVEVGAALGESPMFIDDSPGRTVTEIAATARRLKRKNKHQLGLIVIDYLQLILPDDDEDPRQEQVAKMTRRLKVLARELSVPIICLAQLNRQPETSRDNRPKLSHLRESGAIEQDADVVILVHREEYYLSPQERQNIKDAGDPDQKLNSAEIILAKQRNGPTGDVRVHWFQQYTRFSNAEQRPHEEFSSYSGAAEF